MIHHSTQLFLEAEDQLLSTTPSALFSRFILREQSTEAYRLFHQSDDLPFSVLALLHIGGAGIFTCFPSASPFGYTLGAD